MMEGFIKLVLTSYIPGLTIISQGRIPWSIQRSSPKTNMFPWPNCRFEDLAPTLLQS